MTLHAHVCALDITECFILLGTCMFGTCMNYINFCNITDTECIIHFGHDPHYNNSMLVHPIPNIIMLYYNIVCNTAA